MEKDNRINSISEFEEEVVDVVVVSSIDFEDPKSVVEYGKDKIEEISDILTNTALISSPVSELAIDTSEIEGLVKLDDSFQEIEQSLVKKSPSFILSIKKALSKFGLVKPMEEESYQTKYSEYCEMIDKVIEGVESQRAASAQDMDLRKAMINALQPHIKELEDMIDAGDAAKEEFDSETENMLARLYEEETPSQDEQYEMQNREQVSQIFDYRLDELRRALVLYKEQIQSYRVQQSTEATYLMGCTSFLNSTAPILKAQGSVMAFNYQQQKRLTTMHNLNQAANTAISNNAALLQKNVQDAVDLSLNNGITVETLDRLAKALEQGMKILKQGEEQRQAMVQANKAHLQQLDTVMDSYQEQFRLLESSLDNTSDSKSLVKKRNNGNN